MEEKTMTLDVNEKPQIWKWIILSLQHVFAMFGATILVPILVNSSAGAEVLTIPVALVSSGIGTLIYILCTKGKSPVYLGSSFAFIAPLVAAFIKGETSGALTGIAVVGIIYVLVAIIIRFAGKEWINKLLPPVVIGPMIMIIGLGLAPTAISEIGIAAGMAIEWKSLIVAIVSFLVTAIIMTRSKGFLSVIPFLVGMISGYIVAVCLGMIDFTPVLEASFFSMPKFTIMFKDYAPNFGAVLTIAPIALVTMAEHIGDHTSLSQIIGKNLLKDPGLDRTLLGDGLATLFAGLIGGPANTTYGENTAVVGMTKVASVWVIGLAAIFTIGLGFLGKFTALVSTIPNAVLGGVALLLYGFIAVNGLKVLIQNQIDFNKPKNVVVASSMLVLGLGGAAISVVSRDLSLTISGMSLAAIIGIILNLILKDNKKEEKINKNAEIESEEGEEKTDMKKIDNQVVLEHPIVEHKLSILRDKKTGTKEFREIIGELSMLLCYEALKDVHLEDVKIETPITKMKAKRLDENKFVFLPILRAGTGMIDGVLKVVPNAKIGHIGMYRDEETFKPHNYYYKVPSGIENKEVIIIDPMLATGGSIMDTISHLKEQNVKKIKVLCIIAAPEGLAKVHEKYPEVKIYCTAVDEKLNEKAYIVPGLGDAGDRIFGTK